MKLRYEIRDTKAGGRGQRFTSEDRARKELAQAVGEPGRWILFDRLTKEDVTCKLSESVRD